MKSDQFFICNAIDAPTTGTNPVLNKCEFMTIFQHGDIGGSSVMIQARADSVFNPNADWRDVLETPLEDVTEIRNIRLGYGCDVRAVLTGGSPSGYGIHAMGAAGG